MKRCTPSFTQKGFTPLRYHNSQPSTSNPQECMNIYYLTLLKKTEYLVTTTLTYFTLRKKKEHLVTIQYNMNIVKTNTNVFMKTLGLVLTSYKLPKQTNTNTTRAERRKRNQHQPRHHGYLFHCMKKKTKNRRNTYTIARCNSKLLFFV